MSYFDISTAPEINKDFPNEPKTGVEKANGSNGEAPKAVGEPAPDLPYARPLDPGDFIQPQHTRDEMLLFAERLFVTPPPESVPHMVMLSAVSSAGDSERVSAWAAEMLAAQNIGTVCLVDANVRSPALHRDLCLPNERGFVEFLADDVRNPKTFAYHIADSNFWVMPAGGTHGLKPVDSAERLNASLQLLRSEFDFVLINAPFSASHVAAMVIAPLTDGVVLVVEADRTRREMIWKARHDFQTAQARILGAVLNNRKFPIPGAIYRYL